MWRMLLVLIIACMSKTCVYGLGMDFSKDDLKRFGELVKGQTPVHGYFVNWEDTFFYAGETSDLNRFMEAFGKLVGAKRRLVVIHPGTKRARSPWGPDRDPIDWSFYRWNSGYPDKPGPTRIDIWLGSHIKLDELRIPDGVEVESGGEIDSFVEKIRTRSKKLASPAQAIGRKTPRGPVRV